MSQVFNCADTAEYARGISTATAAVRGGRLVVLPTDTVYGLGCDAFNNDAVAALLRAKHRGPEMPVPVLVGSWDTVDGLVREVTPAMRTLVEAFWPGGLSLVVPQAPSLPWKLGDTRGTVMLRMPLHPVAIELLRATGPMGVSSANISGSEPATTCIQAKQQLGGEVSVYLDGGASPIGQPSTIVDLSSGEPRILREGAITAERIGEVLDKDPSALRHGSGHGTAR